MNPTQVKILSQFSSQMQSHIVEFCKVLSLKKCDVFILLARKAACFISVLEDVGLVTLHGKVVSERILDYNTDWLEDKDVVLIDDTIISGTSIYKIIEKLNDIKVKSIDVSVFCVNEFWFVPEMLESKENISYLKMPYLTLDHSTSLTFCKDIVKMFTIFPRPYSTDFPIFESLRLTEYQYNNIQTLENWSIVDTTSKLQVANNISSFSIIPQEIIVAEFYDMTGISLKRFSYIKLRFYNEKFIRDDKRSYYLCRILPLLIFDPISNTLLKKLVEVICKTEDVPYKLIDSELKSDLSRLRFVQYYFAKLLFKFCINHLNLKLQGAFTYIESQRETYLIFPPELVHYINRFQYSKRLSLDGEVDKSEFSTPILLEKSLKKPFNPLKVKHILYKRFLDLYYKKELVARRIVKNGKKEAFNEPKFKQTIDRLIDGYTFNDLYTCVKAFFNTNYDCKLFISNFLDNAIDSGIIVPVTIEVNGFTSRGYRHGEEIIWGENNDKLLAIFYDRFLECTDAKTFKRFWFEKLLVLFLKMGLKKKILDEYNYSVPPPETTSLIGCRSYLHGLVTVSYELKPSQVTKFHPVLDYDVKGHWTSQRFKDLGIVKMTDEETYHIDTKQLFENSKLYSEDEPKDLAEKLSDSAEEMAELLGIAKNNKVLNAEGLVLLTSCLTVQDNISSLAAEIYIFNQHIPSVLNWIRSALSRSSFTITFLENLRKSKTNYAWTAINSGTEKYLNFVNGEGKKLVNTISENFKKQDSFKKRSWDSYWKSEVDSEVSDAPDLYSLNGEIGLVIIEINVLMIYVHLLIYEILQQNGTIKNLLSAQYEKKQSFIKEIDACSGQLNNLLLKKNSKAQTEINFESAKQVKILESRIRDLKELHKEKAKEIKYWENYENDNKERVGKFVQEYSSISKGHVPFNEVVISILTSSYNNSSAHALSEEINKSVLSLSKFKDMAFDLLQTFSLLVPHWGKINPVVPYSSLIHVNTSDSILANRNQLASLVKKVVADFEHEEFSSESFAVRSVVLLRPIKAEPSLGYFIGGKGQFKIDRMTRLAAKLLEACSALPFDYKIFFYPALAEESVIKAYYNVQTTYYDQVHDDFQKKFLDIEDPLENGDSPLVIYNTVKSSSGSSFKKNIEQKIKKATEFTPALSINGARQAEIYLYKIINETMKSVPVIGIVTALPVEYETVKTMFDSIDDYFKPLPDDPNNCLKGIIKNRRGENIEVILAIAKDMGNNEAATIATNLIRSYSSINDIIMVGIAGGVPDPTNAERHVRLGDIVVSNKEGILQYDNIKVGAGEIKIRSNSSKPSSRLIGLCKILEAGIYSNKTPWNDYIDSKFMLIRKAARPSADKDILNIKNVPVSHPTDDNRVDGYPRVHYGAIGSANTLLKDEAKRDFLRDNYQVKAIEMEGSGIADGTWNFSKGYLIVRGIVDYCNDDKNDIWRSYSALAAAAFARAIIELL